MGKFRLSLQKFLYVGIARISGLFRQFRYGEKFTYTLINLEVFPLGSSKKVVNSVRAYATVSLSISAFAEANVACA